MSGFASGMAMDVDVLLKKPVFRKLSVSWLPNSTPASSVCVIRPVITGYVASV